MLKQHKNTKILLKLVTSNKKSYCICLIFSCFYEHIKD